MVVDFTKPFMTLGISILYHKPMKEDPGPFSFLKPLSSEVWISIGISYILVVAALFTLSKVTPYEWTHFKMDEMNKNGDDDVNLD